LGAVLGSTTAIAGPEGAPAAQGLQLSGKELGSYVDWRGDGFLDERKKVAVECDTIPRTPQTAVLLVLGQSNATNEGRGRYAPKGNVFNFNPFTGKCFKAADPLLGATGDGANFATRLGSRLVEERLFSDVVLVAIGVGGTRIDEWAPKGAHHPRLLLTLKQLQRARLVPTYVLWIQGEGNTSRQHNDREAYKQHFRSILAVLRGHGVASPTFVSLTSICRGAPDARIRQAQAELVDAKRQIYRGPDTDSIGLGDRHDGCHFTEAGIRRHAQLWLDTLKQFRSAR
jgi:hypothetical protein